MEENQQDTDNEYKWVKYIKQRIAHNKNFLCAITGPTGSGKSWCAISVCSLIDPEFNERRIVFSAKELMNLINYGNLKSGSCVVWDETQIDLSSRNWQSTMNKVLNYLISTFRHRNIILFFTSPYLDFIDSNTLKMFHSNFETIKIDRKNQACVVKPKLLDYNQSKRKFYTPYLKYCSKEYGAVKLKRWAIPKPSQDLIDKYENNKRKFTDSLNQDIERKLELLDNDGKPSKPLTERQQAVLECWKQGILRNKDIGEKLNIKLPYISETFSQLRKKGHYKEDYEK